MAARHGDDDEVSHRLIAALCHPLLPHIKCCDEAVVDIYFMIHVSRLLALRSAYEMRHSTRPASVRAEHCARLTPSRNAQHTLAADLCPSAGAAGYDCRNRLREPSAQGIAHSARKNAMKFRILRFTSFVSSQAHTSTRPPDRA